jgi:threonine synthase
MVDRDFPVLYSGGMSLLLGLECPECRETFKADQIQTICGTCDSPLLARYDLSRIAQQLKPEELKNRSKGLWRWRELLPAADPSHSIRLGEGDTPLLPLERIGRTLGLTSLLLKDEGLNPTGTFKSRGLSVAVSRAVELGIRDLVMPTAGNAGGALAAYCALAGVTAHVFMPADAPEVNKAEVLAHGAELHLVDGLLDEAGHSAAKQAREQGWFDVSTFKEPYRVEGKKTMGFELAESMEWALPDVLLYPTGGGTGLVGMWKAFEELEQLGWISSERPRMVSVQAEGCAPIVRAMKERAPRTSPWEAAETRAHGLRVPRVFADRLVLQVLRESRGTAVSVSEEDIDRAQSDLAEEEGILACPEGAATLAGLRHLVSEGWVASDDRVVLFNTGSGLKYLS